MVYYCKECGTDKENLTIEDNKCGKCGSEEFSSKEVDKAMEMVNEAISE